MALRTIFPITVFNTVKILELNVSEISFPVRNNLSVVILIRDTMNFLNELLGHADYSEF